MFRTLFLLALHVGVLSSSPGGLMDIGNKPVCLLQFYYIKPSKLFKHLSFLLGKKMIKKFNFYDVVNSERTISRYLLHCTNYHPRYVEVFRESMAVILTIERKQLTMQFSCAMSDDRRKWVLSMTMLTVFVEYYYIYLKLCENSVGHQYVSLQKGLHPSFEKDQENRTMTFYKNQNRIITSQLLDNLYERLENETKSALKELVDREPVWFVMKLKEYGKTKASTLKEFCSEAEDYFRKESMAKRRTVKSYILHFILLGTISFISVFYLKSVDYDLLRLRSGSATDIRMEGNRTFTYSIFKHFKSQRTASQQLSIVSQ